MLDYILQSFWFFPVHLHFEFSFLHLPSASCDQSGNTQEIKVWMFVVKQGHPSQHHRQEQSGHGQDGFLARLLQYPQSLGWQGAAPAGISGRDRIQEFCTGTPSQLRTLVCRAETPAVPRVL